MPASTVALAIQTFDHPLDGALVTSAAAAAGNNCGPISSKMRLFLWNTGGVSRTVTFYVDKFGAEVTLKVITLTAGQKLVLGPFDTKDFANHDTTDDAVTGNLMFQSNSTDVHMAPFERP